MVKGWHYDSFLGRYTIGFEGFLICSVFRRFTGQQTGFYFAMVREENFNEHPWQTSIPTNAHFQSSVFQLKSMVVVEHFTVMVLSCVIMKYNIEIMRCYVIMVHFKSILMYSFLVYWYVWSSSKSFLAVWTIFQFVPQLQMCSKH